MKAVIMAGGEGSRLRPLTCDIPKPMVHLCGKPAICYILDLLARHSVTEAAVTVRYLAGSIVSYFDSGEYNGIHLNFSEETSPLGTAGSVKNAVDSDDGTFIVISGDALCDIDLTAAVLQHRQTGADATIIVTRVADPREYGLVSFDSDMVVTGFIEKPGWTQASTDAANTGIYIINSDIMEMVPQGKEYDFAKDLFMDMLREGKKICAYETNGYWCDIGDLSTYLSCQQDLLSGRVAGALLETERSDMSAGGVFLKSDMPSGDFRLIPPVYIGREVKIGAGSIIGPGTVLCDGVSVGSFARIRSSCVLNDAYIGDSARLTGSVVCSGASVKSGASLFEGSAVGAGSIIGSGAEVLQNVKIWPLKHVADGTRVSKNLRHGDARPDLFDDDGISGEAGVEITPEFCARLGAAVASLKCGKRVGVACGGGRAAVAFKSAFTAGVLSAGAQVWDFGEITEAQTSFSAAFCGLEMTAYISGGAVCSIKLLGEGGLPVIRPVERELEGRLQREEYTRCSWNAYREISDMTGISLLYQQELYRCAPRGLSGMSAQPKCKLKQGARLFEDTLSKLGCDIGDGMIMELSESGTALSIHDADAGTLNSDRVLAICCLIDIEEGYDLVLPYDAPQAAEEIAEKYGKTVKRYLLCPADASDKEIRQEAKVRFWMRDGIMAAIKILDYIKKTGRKLKEINSMLPQFSTITHTIEIDEKPSRILSGFKSDVKIPHEGVMLNRGGGSIMLKPSNVETLLKLLLNRLAPKLLRSSTLR